MEHSKLSLPQIIFGTSALGNLFQALKEDTKYSIVNECIQRSKGSVVFDSAGKYGAGLALEMLSQSLKRLNIPPKRVVISNKLGWLRTELKTEAPSFEPGVWKDLKHDAVQKISYDGIMECFEQGNELLDGYSAQLVSVHDPDEYLKAASDYKHLSERYDDILKAYDALEHLKLQGKVKAIGVGAKNWKVIRRIADDVPLDWVMLANSYTIKEHSAEVADFIKHLESKDIAVINAAVFHSGFLVGGDFYDYKLVERGTSEGDALLLWRQKFFAICKRFHVPPAAACVQFALNAPGVKSVALNANNVIQVKENFEIPKLKIPMEFWDVLRTEGLVNNVYENNVENVELDKNIKKYF